MPATTRPTPPKRPRRGNGAFHAATAATLLPVALSLIPAAGSTGTGGGACGVYCAKERWAVKTLSDGAAHDVDMTPRTTTVSQLVAQAAPTVGSNERVPPLETQVYTVQATLLGYRQETDHDFHIVIADQSNAADTMIVEIPDPACTGVCSSLARDQITAARSTFATAFAASPPKSQYVSLVQPVTITVTGVPMFDFKHGQVGLARNCIELHPVLQITIPTDQPLAVRPGHEPPPAPAFTCMPEVPDTEL